MTLLEKNIGANLFGNIWQVVMSLLFIPLYIKFMGVESYGLIGIYIILSILAGMLDMGLSGTLNREMARRSMSPGKEQEMRNLARSLEVVYWGASIIIGIVIIVLSPFIAHHLVKAEQLSPHTIEQAIMMMGLALLLLCPAGFYSGGLLGLQRHVLYNVINAVMSTFRYAGVVLVLWLISPTIQAFFLWQIVVNVVHTFLLALYFWSRLPVVDKQAVFQKQLLKGIWRFAAGIGGTTIFGIVLTQLDKIILSIMLPLEMFGYYTLASVVAMSPLRLSGPMFNSIYPQFTQLFSLDDQEGLKQLYHKGCQFMAVLILPASVIIALFSYEIILLWTQNPLTAENTYLLISILVCGTALNALMHLPYALQWASGWTRLSFFKSLVAVILYLPLIVYMTITFGAIGAASSWLILNIGYVFLEVPIMHRRLLRRDKWRWYRQDVFMPLFVASVIAASGKLFINHSLAQVTLLTYLIVISALTLGITAIITPVMRGWILRRLQKI